MDKYPTPGTPEGQESEEEILRRKKRFLERLQGLGKASEEPRVIDLSEQGTDEASGELYSRDEELTLSPELERAQQLGSLVVEQSAEVEQLAERVVEKVDALPAESRDAVKPEAEDLKEAATELRTATEELEEELEEVEEAVETRAEAEPDEKEKPAPAEAAAPSPEPAKPKKDHSEGIGMAQLVLSTLIGGGIGAIIGESLKTSREKRAKKEKAGMVKKIEKQEVKIAEQQVEIDKLKAEKPKPGAEAQKEYIEKTTELTKAQTEVVQATTEQVREVAKAAAEIERAFKIPEQQKSPEVEGAERLHEKAAELAARNQQLARAAQQATADAGLGSAADSTEQPKAGLTNPTSADRMFASRTWIYWAIVAGAILLALGLLIFR